MRMRRTHLEKWAAWRHGLRSCTSSRSLWARTVLEGTSSSTTTAAVTVRIMTRTGSTALHRATVRRPSPETTHPRPTRRFPLTRATTALTWRRQSPICRAPRRRARALTDPRRITPLASTGTASGDPQLPSPTQALRANPARPARRNADPSENESDAASSSAVSSSAMSDGEAVPGCYLDAPGSSSTPNGGSRRTAKA